MKVVAIIPSRYASTRLPGKPLAKICGKTMIERVLEIAQGAKKLAGVYVATDDSRIAKVVEKAGGKVVMTSSACSSGTERLIEAANIIDADVYINVQGDEPLLESKAIDVLVDAFEDEKTRVASLYCPMDSEEASLPQNVKVVMDHKGDAMYFSRAPIPFPRDKSAVPDYKCHLGIYGYRRKELLGFASLPSSPLEKLEQLEQLRYLQAGIPIRMLEAPKMGGGVDTPEDLEKARKIIAARKRELAIEKLASIKVIVSDVDGVLTDGSLYYGPEGEIIKKFNAKDGGAIKELQRFGVKVAILSGRSSEALKRRAEDLGIKDVVMDSRDKGKDFIALLERLGARGEECAYIGDDYPDLPVCDKAGVFIAAPGAIDAVREIADLAIEKEENGSFFSRILEYVRGCA